MTNTAKVGDRIRVLRDGASGAEVSKGDIGVVTSVWFNGTSVDARFSGTRWALAGKDYEILPRTLAEMVDGHAEVPTPKAAPTNDAVFRPAHYARFAIEPITFITANSLGFLPGNVIKYVLRHDAKNGIEDLKKARRYIDIMIEDLERRARGEAIKVEAV